MGIKTLSHSTYSPDLAPCDFWLFPNLRGCRYETIEDMKEAVTKVVSVQLESLKVIKRWAKMLLGILYEYIIVYKKTPYINQRYIKYIKYIK